MSIPAWAGPTCVRSNTYGTPARRSLIEHLKRGVAFLSLMALGSVLVAAAAAIATR